jgi:predicted nuclease of predicted toxin-antitoxin system
VNLLFDQNLSPKLVDRLADIHPSAAHVRTFGMRDKDDRIIWQFAGSNNYCIVTKDGDYRQMSMLYGAPPKVIWLRIGNAPTRDVATLMRSTHAQIVSFLAGTGAILTVDP